MKASEIRSLLTGEARVWDIAVVDVVRSTSDELKQVVANDVPRVLFAERQTHGRGRRDNVWQSQAGKDLMFSVAWRPAMDVSLWSRATLLAALALCEAIEEELPLSVGIKWPNDLWIEGRKVAGLLAETSGSAGQRQLVLGIGLNVNTVEFPAELDEGATSLKRACGARHDQSIDRAILAARVLNHLGRQLSRMDEGFVAALSEVRARSCLLQRQVKAVVQGREVFGRAVDLNAEGGLVLELGDGSRSTLTSVEGIRAVL